jgi:hypothetical protein
MENKIVYKCTGNCGGVSFHQGTCTENDCTYHAHKLTPVEQCDNCAALTAKDNRPHACEMCKVI